MRPRLAALLVAAFGLAACKSRPTAGGRVLDADTAAASPGSPGGCTPAVASGANGVAATSLASLIARSGNPACQARFLRLPLVRQTKGFTCGAASLKSILFYYGDFFAETELQRILESHKDQGTSFKRIIRFLNALNDDETRARLTAVYGFDSKVDLGDLAVVLKDPKVLAAIRSRANGSSAHAAVLAGAAALLEDDVDLDTLASTTTGLSLRDDGADASDVDRGRRVQPDPPPAARDGRRPYAMRLFFDARPYPGSGPLPAGCPASPPPPAPGDLAATRGMTLAELQGAIDAGHPVLALTQAWSFTSDGDYDLAEYERAWYSGHYVVVVGYDRDNIYYMDPYNMGHYTFLPKGEWEKRWHDYDGLLAEDGTTRCPGGTELHRFGLVVERAGGSRYEPDLITKMY